MSLAAALRVVFGAAELLAGLPAVAPEPHGPQAPAGNETIDPEHAPTGPVSLRVRQVKGPRHRSVHELKDPAGWPAEPPAPAGELDPARFEGALVKVCVRAPGLDLSRLVLAAAAGATLDPFLLGALVVQQSGCRPDLETAAGVGLLQIQPAMYAEGAALPFERGALDPERLRDPALNLAAGAALLRMWQAEHAAELDARFPGVPHRTAVAHFVWGDQVWGANAEDRVLTVRRRLLEAYADRLPVPGPSPLGWNIVSPLGGVPRLGTSGPGADREGGKRQHRGLDIDALEGEPVRAISDGVVQFAGADLPGRQPARPLLPRQIRRARSRRLGAGGIFVRIDHADDVRSGYFHLQTFTVVAGQSVRAGDVIGTVGRTGVKVSPSHLHFEVRQEDRMLNPAQVLTSFVIPPEGTVTHELAMAQKKQRLKHERRLRRKRLTS